MKKNIMYAMSLIALSGANSLNAMEPKKVCPFAYTKLKLASIALSGGGRSGWETSDHKMKIFKELYDEFEKMCPEEKAQNEKAKQNSKKTGHSPSHLPPGPWGQR